jgi:hypothetical protein
MLVAGTGVAFGSGLIALTRRGDRRQTRMAVRFGVATLIGTAVVALLAIPIVISIGGDLWLAVDAAVLVAALAFVALGVADLRRADVPAPAARVWMTVGATSLVVLATILALE